MVVFVDDHSQRLPHINFTPNNRPSALSSSGDSDASDHSTPNIMYNASYAAGSSIPEETLLAMQELRMNTTHPFLTHTLRQPESSVLSLAADSQHIFSGSQGKDIYVWDRETMQVKKTLKGHSGSVLNLVLSEEKKWLFSSSSDSTVRVWSSSSLIPLYVIHPHGETDAGDIYSLSFSYTSPSTSRSVSKAILFFGCQNTSLQWIDLSSLNLNTSHGRSPGLAVTGSSSDYELEFEFEDNEYIALDYFEDERHDEQRLPDSKSRAQHGGSRHPRPPKKLHKFFDSQPHASRTHLSTQSTASGSSATTNDTHGSYTVSRNTSFSSTGSLDKLSSLNPDSTSKPVRSSTPARLRPRVLRVPSTNVVDSAHYGYIYCMGFVYSPSEEVQLRPFGEFEPETRYTSEHNIWEDGEIRLVTGSGDEDLKMWSFQPFSQAPSPVLSHTFKLPSPQNSCPSSATCGGAILSVMVRNGCIYAGCQDGLIVVWSLETKSVVKSIFVKENVDVLSLSLIDTDLYVCLSDGEIQRWSGTFACSVAWKAHDGIVLSSVIVPSRNPVASSSDPDSRGPQWLLITGASDNHIKLWDIEPPSSLTPGHRLRPLKDASTTPTKEATRFSAPVPVVQRALPHKSASSRVIPRLGVSNETMIHALAEFVGIPSVTASKPHQEFCRQAAIWLRASLAQLGAEAYLLPSAVDGKNPLVLGTFHGASRTSQKRSRVLFYGHYDVIAAPPQAPSYWRTPPFTLTGVDGYLYGRGVTDNKGPIIASACAAATLLARHELDCDVVFLIEGEEEAASGGFAESVRKYKHQIGHIDAILLSNSYWIDDITPCITYGLRGVVQASLEISSQCSDLHSGVEGGAWNEPVMDMVKLLGNLAGTDSKVLVPGFYDTVRDETPTETVTYADIAKLTGTEAGKISSRWREPSLTIHNMTVSGSNNPTVIPATVKAQISMRIVPDQDLDSIVDALKVYLRTQFDALTTSNELQITIDRTADWWLGVLDDDWFRSLERSVKDEWGVRPLQIREGGSISSVPVLEKEFNCHALHLPMGQSSDQAHLQNERISLNNLCKGRSVVERFFRSVAAINASSHPTT